MRASAPDFSRGPKPNGIVLRNSRGLHRNDGRLSGDDGVKPRLERQHRKTGRVIRTRLVPPAQKTKRRGGEVRKVRENRRKVAIGHPEPFCECGPVLIDGGAGNPPPVRSGVVRPAQRELRELAVDVRAGDGAAHHKMVAAPSVVGAAVRSGLERAAEIGKRKCSHLRRNAQLGRGSVEGGHGRIELREEALLCVELVAVRVEAAERAEENLALQAEREARLHHLRDLLQLAADDCSRENRLQGGKPLH